MRYFDQNIYHGEPLGPNFDEILRGLEKSQKGSEIFLINVPKRALNP